MFRIVLAGIVLAGVAFGVAYYNGWITEYVGGLGLPPASAGEGKGQTKADIEIGGLLYPAKKLPALPQAKERSEQRIVVDPCHAVVPPSGRQDVSFPKDGRLQFIGRPVSDKEPPDPNDLTIMIFNGEDDVPQRFRPLAQGMIVKNNQIVAVVDPMVAIKEVASKSARVAAAQAELEATSGILEETRYRLGKLKEIMATPGGKSLVTYVELSDAEVAVVKYKGDKAAKEEAVKVAKTELSQAQVLLSQHFLKSAIEGDAIIRKIHKTRGEGLKPQDTVMELYSLRQLTIAGSVDSQHYATLLQNKNAQCYLEPLVEMEPLDSLHFHQAEVTCVAVCADGKHFVSGSEDHNVLIWHLDRKRPLKLLEHDSPVRSVAASPAGMRIAVGCADGSLVLWDISKPADPKQIRSITGKHDGAITALAFSGNGKFIASGGADSKIVLWKSDDSPEVLYALDADHGAEKAHNGVITSLHFTPQCTLVSAARPNSLCVWELHQKGVKLLREITNRGGAVGQLGVTSDGQFMLFDKGKTLQILNTVDGLPVCKLDNLAGLNPFDTLAMFSPDGAVMLTGGAGEGRLHLWKTPTADEYAFQIRELVTKDPQPVTSAAFAPHGHHFAVTGSKDGRVHIWILPSDEAISNHRILADGKGQPLQLDSVAPEVTAGKTAITVNVLNPQDKSGNLRLRPGQRVTLVLTMPLAGK